MERRAANLVRRWCSSRTVLQALRRTTSILGTHWSETGLNQLATLKGGLNTVQRRYRGSNLTILAQPRNSAILPIRTGPDLAWLLAVRITNIPVAALAIILARIGDAASISVVGIDTAQHAAVDGDGVLDDDVAGAAVAGTVAAAAHDLAVILGVKVPDTDSAPAVELEDLVLSLEGAAAVDVGGPGGLLEGGSVLADIGPPDVVQRAMRMLAGSWHTFVAEDDRALPGSFAVDAFGLTLADDDVGESGAILEDEHGVLLARLRLALTDGCWVGC